MQIIQFRAKEAGKYRPIVIADDIEGMVHFIIKEIWNYEAASLESIPNNAFLEYIESIEVAVV